MSEQMERIDPERLPFQLEDELGEIVLAEQPYPGVYYIAAQKNEAEIVASEYYVVMKDSPVISQTVKNYGQVVDGCSELLLYSMSEDKSGWRLVHYEGLKYLTQSHLPLPEQTSLHTTAVYNMEYHPEYFGLYPAPTITPAGYTLRYKQLDNGIYWLETDQCERMLSVCYPIWSSELSGAAQSLGQQTEHDQAHGISNTLGCLFFSERDSCVPLFELLQLRGCLETVDKAALMNAVWQTFPEYAAAYNLGEQSGAHDILGQLLNVLGEKVELSGSAENVITIHPEAGTDFAAW